jgi:hypothetical protein
MTNILRHRTSDKKRRIRDHVDSDVWLERENENLLCEEETYFFARLKNYLTILKFYYDD